MKIYLIFQKSPWECGVACLAMIGAYYGKGVRLEKYRKLFDSPLTQRQNFNEIYKAANKIALSAIGVKVKKLDKTIWFPCIGQIEITEGCPHFVIIYSIDKNIMIADPAHGLRLFSKDTFNKIFTGNVLLFSEKNKTQNHGLTGNNIKF